MAQLTSHEDDGTFLFYYTRPDLAGTPDFEHVVRVSLSAVKRVDADTLVVQCPCGCNAVASVSIHGGEEAWQLHARYQEFLAGEG